MITVSVDLHRFGKTNDPKNKTISKAFIWNQGPISLFRHEYGYMILIPDAPDYAHPRQVRKEHIMWEGVVDHTRSDGVWWLVVRVMAKAGGYSE